MVGSVGFEGVWMGEEYLRGLSWVRGLAWEYSISNFLRGELGSMDWQWSTVTS